jgi:uncharacterized protein
MKRVLLMSDTHVPSRAARLPPWVDDLLPEVDHVIHAGDFDSRQAYERIGDRATALTAVRGNTDPYSLSLPRVATLDVEGVRFVVTHGDGPTHSYRDRVAETAAANAEGVTVGVSGHTHAIHDEVNDGIRLLNPGSASGASPARRQTVMLVDVDGESIAVTRRERER